MSDQNAPDVSALYRALLLEHGKRPRHATLPARIDRRAELDNPLCGDHVTIGVALEQELIAELGFEAEGCLICIASASLLCARVRGSSLAAARALCDRYLALVAARTPEWPSELGALCAFAAVARFPARAGCATLACTALRSALS